MDLAAAGSVAFNDQLRAISCPDPGSIATAFVFEELPPRRWFLSKGRAGADGQDKRKYEYLIGASPLSVTDVASVSYLLKQPNRWQVPGQPAPIIAVANPLDHAYLRLIPTLSFQCSVLAPSGAGPNSLARH